MSFNDNKDSDNKDYFNQWNRKKLMSEEEFNKVTFPLCSPLCFSSSGANHKLVKGAGVGQRGGLAGFPLLFPWVTQGVIAVTSEPAPPNPQPQHKFVCWLPSHLAFFLSLFCFPATGVLDRALFGQATDDYLKDEFKRTS